MNSLIRNFVTKKFSILYLAFGFTLLSGCTDVWPVGTCILIDLGISAKTAKILGSDKNSCALQFFEDFDSMSISKGDVRSFDFACSKINWSPAMSDNFAKSIACPEAIK